MDQLQQQLKEVSNTHTNKQSIQKGRIPPQALDMEEAVLGAMMIDKKGVDEVIDLLKPEAFYKVIHQEIFRAIQDLFNVAQPIDMLTVAEQLRKNGKLKEIGGEYYLIELTQKTSSSAHIESHAYTILEKYIMRSLIGVSLDVLENAYDETSDVFEVLDKTETKLYEVAHGNVKQQVLVAKDLVAKAKKKIEKMFMSGGVSGITTGFTDLDKLTSGLQPSDLIIIAARPGMGKTAMSLSIACNIAVGANIPVAFFSLEMSSIQLIMRLISSETGLSSETLRSGRLENHEWEQLNIQVKNLEKAPLYIDDTPSISIFELRAKARRLASKHNIKLIIIDYLQLMTAGTNSGVGNREQEISTISRNLKALAKELDLPVIALSQLSRAVETRSGSKRPQLSDLRESGAIEQDADIVSFIYRPEYYKIETWDDEEEASTKGQGELIIAKHRNGGLSNIRFKFIGSLGRFENLEDSSDYSYVVESKMNKASTDIIGKLPNSAKVFEDNNETDIPPSLDKDVYF